MIIYIHGFGESGEGTKASIFREYFKKRGKSFVAPTLNYNPKLAISTLEELINSFNEDIYLIGSSLGGYYAMYLSQIKKVKRVVLINPSTKPTKTLKNYLGLGVNFYDNSHFEWNIKHIKFLEEFKIKEINKDKFFLLLQDDDDIIDYKNAKKLFSGAKMVIESGGGHGFEGIENYLQDIEEFFYPNYSIVEKLKWDKNFFVYGITPGKIL